MMPGIHYLIRPLLQNQRFWSLADQGIQSLYSFCIVVMAGRMLNQGEFGVFSLIWAVFPIGVLLLNVTWATPLGIIYPVVDVEKQAIHVSLARRMGMWFILFACMSGIAAAIAAMMELKLVVLIAAATTITFVRIVYEIPRRLSLARNEVRTASLLSAMALGPSMVIIPIFFAYHGIASGINLFLIILIIVLSASMPWIVTKIRALPKQQTGHGSAVRAVAGYAAPLTIAAIIDIVAKLLAPFYLAAVRSTEDVGAWSTGRNLMGPVQVILIGLANSAIPLARGGYAKDGRRGAIHETIILARWMIPLYLIPLALIFWWAPAIIGIVFGVVYEGSDTILRIYCIAYLIMGANTLFSSLLTALGSVRQQVVVSILSAVIYLGGLPFALAHWGGVGVAGMAIAGEISSLCVLIVYYFCYHRGPPEPRTYIHG